MSLLSKGATYKIIRNGEVLGTGTTESNSIVDHRKAVAEAFRQYTETMQFEEDTYQLSGNYNV